MAQNDDDQQCPMSCWSHMCLSSCVQSSLSSFGMFCYIMKLPVSVKYLHSTMLASILPDLQLIFFWCKLKRKYLTDYFPDLMVAMMTKPPELHRIIQLNLILGRFSHVHKYWRNYNDDGSQTLNGEKMASSSYYTMHLYTLIFTHISRCSFPGFQYPFVHFFSTGETK